MFSFGRFISVVIGFVCPSIGWKNTKEYSTQVELFCYISLGVFITRRIGPCNCDSAV